QEVRTLDKKEGEINIHDNNKTLQLNATYAGGSNTDPIVWSSSAESVATVDQNGLVTGVAVGETTITAKKSETLYV
ncbi:MAG: Ig-like domain-containing protein, partial [Clostridiales bacterium]